VGAGDLNQISSAGVGSFIGGGGTYGAQTATTGNTITGEDSFIGAGGVNTVAGNDDFVGAGYGNSVGSGAWTVVVGGTYNEASANSAFVGGGGNNAASGSGAFLGGGGNNKAAATESFIGGGGYNNITSSATYSVLAGGYGNTLSGEYAAIGGGYGNEATGEYAAVAGGDGNTAAGAFSFAGGYHADAVNSGSFVWSDHKGSTVVKDTAQNQYVVRASGGVYFYSNPTLTSGVSLPSGSGAWSNLSDRNAKTGIVPLDDASILAKVAALPIDRWSYKSEKGVRHMGPMAQDFYAAFGVGEDNRHITSIDEDGVALAAIKALNVALHRENAALAAKDAALERRLDALEARMRT